MLATECIHSLAQGTDVIFQYEMPIFFFFFGSCNPSTDFARGQSDECLNK